ncbi:MAG: MotA/TolQ/ExbB proton channel family protein [Myxococcota bacterium]|nr:MotA/TolQ/ExbB proton channel family protein [Myxococcota bacterium]
MKKIILLLGITIALVSVGVAATAQEAASPPPKAKATSLNQLLQKVKEGWRQENVEMKERERRFIEAKADRAQMLKDAEAAFVAEQRRSEQLEMEFDQNKVRLGELNETLKNRLGTMGELFGVIRQVAGDIRSQVEKSLVSAQFPERADSLEALATSKSLPKISQLEQLWYVIQQELIEQGRSAKFSASVVDANGEETQNLQVARAGIFNAVAGGKFLQWDGDRKKLIEFGRQPPSYDLATAADFEEATSGMVELAIDPSQGVLLGLLVQTPSAREKVDQGGAIGYTIIIIGVITFLIAVMRMFYLIFVNLKVQRQRTSPTVRTDNPLGRVIKVYEDNPDVAAETLELKLDEAILRESTKLDRLLWAVKIASVVAPLLGLLGTVTGMIRCFQQMALFGAGDPRYMADGISEALVTTMLGLYTAIPLVLMHSTVRSMSKRVTEVLEEQSAGIIAKRAEQVR